jgi:hypothetical protein
MRRDRRDGAKTLLALAQPSIRHARGPVCAYQITLTTI